jgi:hypothetical protein
MNSEDDFKIWMSRVEFYLELMVKKTTGDFNTYDYRNDYINNYEPEQTAIHVIEDNIQQLKPKEGTEKWLRKIRG